MNCIEKLEMTGEGGELLIAAFRMVLNEMGERHVGFKEWHELVAAGEVHSLTFNGTNPPDRSSPIHKFPCGIKSAETMAQLAEGWLDWERRGASAHMLNSHYESIKQPSGIDGTVSKGWRLVHDLGGTSIFPHYLYYGK